MHPLGEAHGKQSLTRRGCVDGGREELSSDCTSLPTVHKAPRTPPRARCCTTVLPNTQPIHTCKYLPTAQDYTQENSQEAAVHTPCNIDRNHHITLISTQHSICSSWVRWCILSWHASFLTESGLSSIIVPKAIGSSSSHTNQHMPTNCSCIDCNTSTRELPVSPHYPDTNAPRLPRPSRTHPALSRTPTANTSACPLPLPLQPISPPRQPHNTNLCNTASSVMGARLSHRMHTLEIALLKSKMPTAKPTSDALAEPCAIRNAT